MSEDLTKKLPKGDDNVALILQNIDSRLLSLEQKVEERLHDTRPIWQKVVADIAQLQEGQTQLQESQQRIAETMSLEFREIKTSIRDLFRRFSMVNDTLATIQIDYRDIYDRVRGLEIQQKPSNSST
jgi:hypothetical protein